MVHQMIDLRRTRYLIATVAFLFCCGLNLLPIWYRVRVDQIRVDRGDRATFCVAENVQNSVLAVLATDEMDLLHGHTRIGYQDLDASEIGTNPAVVNVESGSFDSKAAFRMFAAQYALAPRVLVVANEDLPVTVVHSAGKWVVRLRGKQ